MSLFVKSSSLRVELLNATEGRTYGGGTGSTVMIIQSGRAKSGFKPSARTSSSGIAFRMAWTRSAVMSCLRSAISGKSFRSSRLRALNSAMICCPSILYVGCGAPLLSSTVLPLQRSWNLRRRCFGFLIFMHSLYLGSFLSSSSLEEEKLTQRSTLSTTFRKPWWNTGLASSRWPKYPGQLMWSASSVWHLSPRSSVPSRRSDTPPFTGFPFS
mmetsp:Transcript_10820/g.37579  ORF Transcript_10820/g.37579 Transcript_10820/m.37579 type:complete len:213 (+) Transcript_10820:4195-4833(+)